MIENGVERWRSASQDLERFADDVDADNVAALLSQGIDKLGEELPGRSEQVESLAGVFRSKFGDLGDHQEELGKVLEPLESSWSGQGSVRARGRIEYIQKLIDRRRNEIHHVVQVLERYAGTIRELDQTHGSLRSAMRDQLNKVDGVGDRAELEDAAGSAARLFSDAAGLCGKTVDAITEAWEELRGVEPVEIADLAGGRGQSAPVGTGNRLTQEQLLEKYQVEPDPDGMTDYPPAWLAAITGTDQQEVTNGEADLLNGLGFEALKFRDVAEEAHGTAETAFEGQGFNDGHADAFRHAYWNARMTQEFGEEWTADYAVAHERIEGNPADRAAMDLHNNEIGREIGRANPDASPEELQQLVEQAVRDGQMVVVPPGGGLDYSDMVEPGETGEARLATNV